jgi:hypothetical protein
MALPNVSVSVRDGGLAIVPPGSQGYHAKIGPAPFGVINTVYALGNDNDTLQTTLGKGGPLVEAAALANAVGGLGTRRPSGQFLVPVNPSTYGTASAVTKVGTGAGTVAVAIKPSKAFQIKCILGGATATSTWQTSVDGGVTYGATWVSAATVQVPGASFVTLAFGGGTAVVGDVVTVSTTGTTALASGSGTLTPTLSSACPLDAYSVKIVITTAGALQTAQFTYSLDGGTTTIGPILTTGSGVYVIPDTGLQLTLASTFVAGDQYTFTTTTASFTSTDLTNAFNALVAQPYKWSFLHIVGPAASVGAAATLLATVDLLMGTAASSYRFARAILEVPSDTDANILSAFAASSSLRVAAAAGFVTTVSVLNGRSMSRPLGWHMAARAAAVPPQEDLGRVQTGSLPGATALSRDESATPGLDNAGRFTTATTILGRNGFFITQGRLMAPVGSDFTFWQYGRVMDQISDAARTAFLKFLNDSVRVNSDGTISEKDAQNMESSALNDILNSIENGSVSSLSVTIDRTTNVLATQTISPKVRAVPLGYAKFVPIDAGFTSTGLAVKAA